MRSLFISFFLVVVAALSACAGPGESSGGPEAPLLATSAEGFGLHERQGALQQIRAWLRRLKTRAEQIERLQAEQVALLLSPDFDPAERRALARDLDQLSDERAAVALRLRALKRQQAKAERDYEDYRRHVASSAGG